MPLHEITFRYQHDSPFNDLSKRYPTLMFSVWDNYQKEFMEVSCQTKGLSVQLDRDLKNFVKRKGSKLIHKSEDKEGTRTLTLTCACDRTKSSTTTIADSNCLLLPPITFYDGWGNYRIVGFGGKDASKAIGRLEKRGVVEVTSKRTLDVDSLHEFCLISMKELFSNLTKLQLDALVTAIEFGYYVIPRKVSTAKMARALMIPRTSLQERRKRAEAKLMAAVAPYALTYSRGGIL